MSGIGGSIEVGATRAGGEGAAAARPGLWVPGGAAVAETGRFEARGPFFFRGAAKFYAKGVTYGPFRPNAAGEFFKEPAETRADFALMRELGINTARIYYPPPAWLADLAAEAGIALLVGIPWPEHVCHFGDEGFERSVRTSITGAIAARRGHPAILGYLVGNEIPTTNVRWVGPRVVERFLGDLYETAKEADPEALVSYANYPSTEYLSLEKFDFYTLNLYLHDREPFRNYLARMKNRAGEKPFILGELGIDAVREGEAKQAEILKFSLEEAYRLGIAGSCVFSFTDEWFRGGEEVTGWSFGLTDRERRPRAAARVVADVLARVPEIPLERTPRVSVVVATYNGAATLRETLETLGKVRYPAYETIVIDDGSTDASAAIARAFPDVRLIQQKNMGLSAARNRGIEAASGEIVAFCDSDVAVDPQWLYYLVAALLREPRGVAGVGGPNLPPAGDGRAAAAVSASPGGPTHVLLDDVTAEHIPGCNMAFWKTSLEEVGGFDPRFRAAGDDVDICWRLQDRGLKLAFAPSAIVWHHRRNAGRAYLKQQRGYGEAEADLAAKHPGRYNAFGGALWRGRIYAASGAQSSAPLQRKARIHYGVFGLGLFQTIYQPGGPLLLELAATPEWTVLGALALAGGIFGRSLELGAFGAALVLAAIAVAARLAVRAKLEPRYDTLGTRALVFALSYAQPWVRRLAQLKKARRLHRQVESVESLRKSWFGERAGAAEPLAFWSEEGGERESFLSGLERSLAGDRFPFRRGTGFEPFDLEIGGDPGARVRVATVVEYHGGPKRLLRVRIEPRLSGGAIAALGTGGAAVLAAAGVSGTAALVLAFAVGMAVAHFRRRASWLRRAVLARATEIARKLGFAPLGAAPPAKRWIVKLPSLLFSILP